MADFPGLALGAPTLAAAFVGRIQAAYGSADLRLPVPVVDDPLALDHVVVGAGTLSVTNTSRTPAMSDHAGGEVFETTPATTWFETFHVLPRSLAFGNILSNQSTIFQVYSAFRKDTHQWTTFVNNAGSGTTMVGLPTLPISMPPQSDNGLSLTLSVTVSGQPDVNTTLDFVFDSGTAMVPITLQRIVLLALPPELPYDEQLAWRTDILAHKDGSEQRASVRKNPRQMFEWRIGMDDGVERGTLMNTLFEWQSRTWGIPVWHERTVATAPIAVNDVVIPVRSTDFADYRVGGFVLVYESPTKFDVLTLASLTQTSVTVTSGTLNSFPAGVIVVPMRPAVLPKTVAGRRTILGDGEIVLRFRVTDNDVDLASVGAFPLFNGKVLLDDCNIIRGSLDESFEHNFLVVDNGTGISFQSNIWDRNKRSHSKTFFTKTSADLWAVRQLLHALRGRQTSFYIPSFTSDLVANATLASGSNILSIASSGYSQFVRERGGRNIIRVTFLNGDPPLLRTILSSSIVDPTTESLVLDVTWPNTVVVADIDRIMYVEKVRWDSDTFTLRHESGGRTTRVSGPVKAVFE